ncbi:hypothetical protein [Pseudomonas phage D6]|nr:hypothetical protein [Pseudomonas phage D6]
MTKCVVYIDTQVRDQGTQRSYVNESGSLGMHAPFYEEFSHSKKLFSLDSRCIVFPNPKQAEKFAREWILVNDGMGFIQGRDVIGYHGITENGNACAPFKAIPIERNGPTDIVSWTYQNQKQRELFREYRNLGLPPTVHHAVVSVGREKFFDRREVFGELTYLLENMVDEEYGIAVAELEGIHACDWVCTDIDKFDEYAIVHFSQQLPSGIVQHRSMQIVALNLVPTDILLGMRANGEVEHA